MSNKASSLHDARRLGLPVPPGVIITEEIFLELVESGIVDVISKKNGGTRIAGELVEGTHIRINDAFTLIRSLGLDSLETSLAVRSAFSIEDGSQSSFAGYFKTLLNVNPDKLAPALKEIWDSSFKYKEETRRDVLVMNMVDATCAGVAFTESDYQDDIVNFVSGTAEKLVSGITTGSSFTLPKLLSWEHGIPGAPHPGSALAIVPPHRESSDHEKGRKPANEKTETWATRLQKLLRDVRTAFGEFSWDIEWADDGTTCWLIQIRPVTRPIRRNEVYTIANHKEILPELPSMFMSSLIESCADDLFWYYRQFDDDLPQSRPFIRVFKGRPYINLSLLSDMMRIFGLPTNLVTANIGGRAEVELPANVARLFRKLPTLRKLFSAQLKSTEKAEASIKAMVEKSEEFLEDFSSCIEALRWLYITIVTTMFSLTQTMSGPLLVLRKTGTLSEHHESHETIATQLYKDLEELRRLADANPDLKAELMENRVPQDPRFQKRWLEFMVKHGHRGVFESDISKPRFSEDPSMIIAMLAKSTSHVAQSSRLAEGTSALREGREGASSKANSSPSRSMLGVLTTPVWWQASRAIKARERVRYYSMLAFQRVRKRLVELTEKTELGSTEQLWKLKIEEAKRLDEGWIPASDFWREREKELVELQGFELPDLIRLLEDFDKYKLNEYNATDISSLFGISLTAGEVSGTALVLSDPSDAVSASFDPSETILVARSIDAGWIPILSTVRGLVVEIGGELSHGSILVREIGLPAITNVSMATRYIHTGDKLKLKAGAGVVELNNEQN